MIMHAEEAFALTKPYNKQKYKEDCYEYKRLFRQLNKEIKKQAKAGKNYTCYKYLYRYLSFEKNFNDIKNLLSNLGYINIKIEKLNNPLVYEAIKKRVLSISFSWEVEE